MIAKIGETYISEMGELMTIENIKLDSYIVKINERPSIPISMNMIDRAISKKFLIKTKMKEFDKQLKNIISGE